MLNKNVKSSYPLIVTLIVYFFLFYYYVDYHNIMSLVKEINIICFLFVLLFSLVINIFLIAYIFKKLLNYLGYEISYHEAVVVNAATKVLKNVLPLRVGELSRAWYLKHQYNVNYVKGCGIIGFTYYLHLIGLLFLLSLVSFFFMPLYVSLSVTFLAIFCFFVLFSHRFLRVLVYQMSKWLPGKKKIWVDAFYCFSRMSSLKKSKIFLWCLSIQCLAMLLFLFSFQILNIHIPFLITIIRLPIIFLTSSLPIFYNGIGGRELISIQLFSSITAPENLVSVGMMYGVLDILFPTLIGALFLPAFLRRKSILHGK